MASDDDDLDDHHCHIDIEDEEEVLDHLNEPWVLVVPEQHTQHEDDDEDELLVACTGAGWMVHD